MTVALVLGGAQCLHDDVKAALQLFTPDIIMAVKDIGITWPKVDYWATLHPERLPKELAQRRAANLPDPKAIYTYKGLAAAQGLGIEIRHLATKGGSSGLLGTEAALLVADKAVLVGIPLDPKQVHYRRPKKGGWPPATMYRQAWKAVYPQLKGRVRSMSGWTKELLGAPTLEWLQA